MLYVYNRRKLIMKKTVDIAKFKEYGTTVEILIYKFNASNIGDDVELVYNHVKSFVDNVLKPTICNMDDDVTESDYIAILELFITVSVKSGFCSKLEKSKSIYNLENMLYMLIQMTMKVNITERTTYSVYIPEFSDTVLAFLYKYFAKTTVYGDYIILHRVEFSLDSAGNMLVEYKEGDA